MSCSTLSPLRWTTAVCKMITAPVGDAECFAYTKLCLFPMEGGQGEEVHIEIN